MFILLHSRWDPYKLCWKQKELFFYWRLCPESQVFLKKKPDRLKWWDFSALLSHNNYLVGVWSFLGYWRYLPGFIRHEILINFAGRKKLIFPKDFLLFYKFNFWQVQYWIEDQLADVFTRFYTSASWRWRVEPSATWLDTLKTSLSCTHTHVYYLNPLHPIISLHILHTALYTFLKVLKRRICLPIKSLLTCWPFPSFSWP